MRMLVAVVGVLLVVAEGSATEFHVATNGRDSNSGVREAPLRTIQRAATLAQPGDTITVHAGVYRERVNPPRGGTADAQRIVYQAAPGEKVEIKGSETVKNWTKVENDAWKTTLPNAFFGDFNPYSDLIRGDWFTPNHREHHTGAVYLNGQWLVEAAKLDDVLRPFDADVKSLCLVFHSAQPLPPNPGLWFARVDKDQTTIWAQFKDDPNTHLVEINVRRTIFYPDRPGRNFITVRGFTLCQAATPWAPPTAEQIGLIGVHWSKGWVIENNVIRHSVCSGIALGKHGDEFDNTSADTAEGYVKTIQRAHAFSLPWTKENIGRHLVRNNTISHCEQTGIVGSMGAAFSTITGNTIHDIHVRRLFSGAEMAGIKLHGAVDVEISGNRIYRTCLGLWLDWMAQGTRVTRNLFYDNQNDLFTEVNHGPILVDNNVFLSAANVASNSRGAVYAHNLFAGAVVQMPHDARQTPFLEPHATAVAGLHDNPPGDHQFYNNLFIGRGDMSTFDQAALPTKAAGNVFGKGTRACKFERKPVVIPVALPFKLLDNDSGVCLELPLPPDWAGAEQRQPVTSARLGTAQVSRMAYENRDGSPLQIDRDFFGQPRNLVNPTPGPFANPTKDGLTLWPVASTSLRVEPCPSFNRYKAAPP